MLFPRRLITPAPRLFSHQRRTFFMPPSPPFTSTRSNFQYCEGEPASLEQAALPPAFKARTNADSVEGQVAQQGGSPRLVLTNAAAEWLLLRRESKAITEAWELKDPHGLAKSTWIGEWIRAAAQVGDERGAVSIEVYELQKGDAAIVGLSADYLASGQADVYVDVELAEGGVTQEAKWIVRLGS